MSAEARLKGPFSRRSGSGNHKLAMFSRRNFLRAVVGSAAACASLSPRTARADDASFEEVLAIARARAGGRLLDARKRVRSGAAVYTVMFIDRSGMITHVVVNARTRAVLDVRRGR